MNALFAVQEKAGKSQYLPLHLLIKYCIAVRKKQKSDKSELFSTKHDLPLQRQLQDVQLCLKNHTTN